jgi:acylphosphatase
VKEVYLRVKGRVQGIGYRRWAVDTAVKIGDISGWVRNVETGDVEILMKGPEDKVDEMIGRCHSGPTFARVDKVEFVGGRLSGFLPRIDEGVFRQV